MKRIYEHDDLPDIPSGYYYWQADNPAAPDRSEPVHGHVWRRGNKRQWQCECAREDAERICIALQDYDRNYGRIG